MQPVFYHLCVVRVYHARLDLRSNGHFNTERELRRGKNGFAKYALKYTIFANSYQLMFLLVASVQIFLILVLRQKRQTALFWSPELTYELRKNPAS